jgi:uncharacterized protein YecE (DUF72 family)
VEPLNDLIRRISAHLLQTPPHIAKRKSCQLLREALDELRLISDSRVRETQEARESVKKVIEQLLESPDLK